MRLVAVGGFAARSGKPGITIERRTRWRRSIDRSTAGHRRSRLLAVPRGRRKDSRSDSASSSAGADSRYHCASSIALNIVSAGYDGRPGEEAALGFTKSALERRPFDLPINRVETTVLASLRVDKRLGKAKLAAHP